jgi:dTDP-4-dehydrorhamnose reductase
LISTSLKHAGIPCLPAAIPDHRLPILVTGIAGVAGFDAFQVLRARYPGQVVGIRTAETWRLTGEGIVVCDLDDRETLVRLFETHRFASVLNASGNCALKKCELDPAMAWRINVTGVDYLLDIIQSTGTRLVHLSVDLVYSGIKDGGYVETDPTDPVTVYGRTMAVAEEMIVAQHPGACILRISLPMGPSFNGHAGAIDWIQSRFRKNRPATLYYDEVRTPTYVACLSRLCETLLGNDVSGIFHAGGSRKLSLFQIAQIVNRVGGYDPDLLKGCPRIDAGPMPPRAGNVAMDSTKLTRAMGFDPFAAWPRNGEFVPTDDRWHYRREEFQGSPELLAQALYQDTA